MKFWILPLIAVLNDRVLTKIEKPFIYIYFGDPSEEMFEYYKRIDKGKNCVDSIGFFVHDISPEKVYDRSREWVIFSEENARNIVKFVKKYISEVNLIVCQCVGGVSRSSATATALDECIHGGKSKIWNDRQFVPNKLIYETIKNEWKK